MPATHKTQLNATKASLHMIPPVSSPIRSGNDFTGR
jgi:hypothetical protein